MKQILIASLVVLSLTGCGGNDNNAAISSSDESQTPQNEFLSAGIYQATDGSGYSKFYKFKLDKNGYLEITNHMSNVGLYDTSLAVINSDLDSDYYITAGEYNIKFTYQPTSNIPGTVTLFSLELQQFNDLPNIESKTYNADGSIGTYSKYYKLNMTSSGYIDVTTSGASVHVYNHTLFSHDEMPLSSHYEPVTGNTYLEAGDYVIKFTYSATSNTPGVVSFQKG